VQGIVQGTCGGKMFSRSFLHASTSSMMLVAQTVERCRCCACRIRPLRRRVVCRSPSAWTMSDLQAWDYGPRAWVYRLGAWGCSLGAWGCSLQRVGLQRGGRAHQPTRAMRAELESVEPSAPWWPSPL